MRVRLRRGALLALVVVAALAVSEKNPACPEDGGDSYFTGNSRSNDVGNMMYEYKCFKFGHTFWSRKP